MIAGKRIGWIGGACIALAAALVFLPLYLPGAAKDPGGADQGYETGLFGRDVITVDIRMGEGEWEEMLENAAGEEYVSCDVTVDGTQFLNAAIRPKGNTSLSAVVRSGSDRLSFKIKFDEYVNGQTCRGLGKLVLNNNFADATSMKEYLSYQLLDFMDVPAPLCTYADVTVNGEPWGLYLALEPVEEEFALRNFGSDYGELYKPDKTDGRGGNKSARNSGDLKYTDDEVESYSTIFDSAVFNADEQDYKRVITALRQLSLGEELKEYIDVDEVLRYFAVNTFLVNLDSYQGNLKHNYYLYEEDGVLSILPWDYNLSFGAQSVKDASSAVNFPVDTPYSGTAAEDSPLLGKLLEVEEYNALYHRYLQKIVDEYVNGGLFSYAVKETDQRISSYVAADPTAFYTLEQYQAGVEALKTYVLLRSQSVEGQLAGTVPSTGEAQQNSPEKLIDGSALKMSELGQMNIGGQTDAGQGRIQNGQAGGVPADGQMPRRGNQDDGAGGGQMPWQGQNIPDRQNPQNRQDRRQPPDNQGGAEAGGKNGAAGQMNASALKEWVYDGAVVLVAAAGVVGMFLYRRRKWSKLN